MSSENSSFREKNDEGNVESAPAPPLENMGGFLKHQAMKRKIVDIIKKESTSNLFDKIGN
jgi:hypothetical protein